MQHCRRTLHRRTFTVAQFARFCSTRTMDPIHPIWVKYRRKYESTAGHEAARYMLRSIELVIVPAEEGGRDREKAGPILLEATESRTPTRNTGRVYPPAQIRRSPDLMVIKAEQYRAEFVGITQPAVDLLGGSRVKEIVTAALTEFPDD
jgi:hypothetical protein